MSYEVLFGCRTKSRIRCLSCSNLRMMVKCLPEDTNKSYFRRPFTRFMHIVGSVIVLPLIKVLFTKLKLQPIKIKLTC